MYLAGNTVSTPVLIQKQFIQLCRTIKQKHCSRLKAIVAKTHTKREFYTLKLQAESGN